MNTRWARLAGALAALVVLAAACGDDDATTTTAETAAEESEQRSNGDTAVAGDATADEAATEGDETAMEDGGADEGAMGDEHAMGEGEHGHSHSHADGIEISDGAAVPGVSVEITPDPVKGQNLQVRLENFTVAPEMASLDPVEGEGHLHLYVDGEKVLRFYNTWLHLDLAPGEHTIDVEVSANNHSPYTVDGVPIRATAVVDVPEPAEHAHGHSDVVDVDAAGAPEISVAVTKDPKSGWNIRADVENLVIAPEAAGSEHVAGQGHLHLYVDGRKITRMYGTWWHLADLAEGDHEIMVEASANSHAAYALAGEPITATATVSVSADEATVAADPDTGDEAAGGAEADVIIPVEFVGGSVTVADDRIEVERGSVVMMTIASDVSEHVHVHGYDLFANVGAGEEAVLMFTADVPGVFEIEFEDSFTFITELEVR